MPEPAKLELLTREPGGIGFQVHEVESSQAHLQFKPKRLPETDWELTAQPRSPDGSRNYILRSLRRDRYVLLTPEEKFLWEHFDGHHSLSEIARAFHFQFGAFEFAVIRQFLAKLYHVGLLEEFEAASGLHRARPNADGRRRARVKDFLSKFRTRLAFKLTNADYYCERLYRWGGFVFFQPVVFWAIVALTAAAVVALALLAPRAGEISLRLAGRPILVAALVISMVPVVSMLHVLTHALACKSYGRNVREMGFFLLQGIVPTFYADVTDIFMSSRRARVIVDLAGPLVEVVLGSLAFLGAYGAPPGFGQALLFGAGILLWEGAVINLYPFSFLELDGYNILADLLAMPTLRNRSLELYPTLSRRFRDRTMLQKSEWIQLGYLALCLVSVIAYLIAHLDWIGIEISGWPLK
jgi:putative peptide zinc metalloprotease protein